MAPDQGWITMRFKGTDPCSDFETDLDYSSDDVPSSRDLDERYDRLLARKAAKDAKREAGRMRAVKQLVDESIVVNKEDSDSEYEPEDKYCDKCFRISHGYADAHRGAPYYHSCDEDEDML